MKFPENAIWGNFGYRKLIEVRDVSKSKIYADFDEKNLEYWFDFKKKKFLHTIDTFYYSVMFSNDFTSTSQDVSVKKFRRYFEGLKKKLEDENKDFDCLSFYLLGFDQALLFKRFSFAGYYTICLECPEMFDIFLAPRVPQGRDGKSVTTQVVVQLRSYPLWVYGTHRAFEMSYKYVQIIADYFGLTVEYTQENRADYCWHSNYFASPEKFFVPQKYFNMRVTRLTPEHSKDGVHFIYRPKGSADYDIGYIAEGKRGDKIFLRIYHKSREVVEKGYKPWFLKVWLLNGLINRYDFYVYEKAFLKGSWKYIDYARLEFYLEFGKDAELLSKCAAVIEKRENPSADSLRKLADECTPKINVIMNVEFQVMRKHSKSYYLIPFKDNSNKGIHKRIYDYLDNHALIVDYLTNDVFRLVEDDSSDTNKSRRPMCSFWKSLRSTRLVDCVVKRDDLKLVREYNRKLNSEVVKARAIKSAITYGLYNKGIQMDNPKQDIVEMLCTLNDNDMQDALRFKAKKIKQLNEDELSDLERLDVDASYRLLSLDSGEVITFSS